MQTRSAALVQQCAAILSFACSSIGPFLHGATGDAGPFLSNPRFELIVRPWWNPERNPPTLIESLIKRREVRPPALRKPSVPRFLVVGTPVDLHNGTVEKKWFGRLASPLDILWVSLYIGKCSFAPFSAHICPLLRCPFAVINGCRIAPFFVLRGRCLNRLRAVMAGGIRPLRADHRHHVVAAQKEDFRPISAPASFGPDQPSRRRQIAQGALYGIGRGAESIGKRVGSGGAMGRLMVRKLRCENMGEKPGHRRQITVTCDSLEPAPPGTVPVSVLIDAPCSGGGVGVLFGLKPLCFVISPGCARQRAGVFVCIGRQKVRLTPNFANDINGRIFSVRRCNHLIYGVFFKPSGPTNCVPSPIAGRGAGVRQSWGKV